MTPKPRPSLCKPKTKLPDSSYYKLCHEMIAKNREQRDQFIGTLMMLAFDGCISDSRAREIIKMDAYEWRRECARIISNMETPL